MTTTCNQLPRRRVQSWLPVVALLIIAVLGVPSCSHRAVVVRTNGDVLAGARVAQDADVIVLRRPTLIAQRSEASTPAGEYEAQEAPDFAEELVIPLTEVSEYHVQNRHAFRAGLAGAIIFGIMAVPMSIALKDCAEQKCPDNLGTTAFGLGAGALISIVGFMIHGFSLDDWVAQEAPAELE